MVNRSAVLSIDRQYRYRLERELDPDLKTHSPPVVFVLCNPSTADGTTDDATVRKCGGFTRRMKRSRFMIVNIFAYRSRHPKDLLKIADPVGPDNHLWVQSACRHVDAIVVVGWGECLPSRLRHVIAPFYETLKLDAYGRKIMCFGKTSTGMPRHPLMLSYSTPLETYEP